MKWNWNNLPEREHDKLIQAYEDSNMGIILKLHNDYNISENDYGCCGGNDWILYQNCKEAIENEYVKRSKKG